MVDLIESQLYSSDQMFTHFKTYDDQKSSFGYLVVPISFITVQLEHKFKQNVTSNEEQYCILVTASLAVN